MNETQGIPVAAWTATLRDSEGAFWTFDYTGGSSVRIKPQAAPIGHWTNTISLDYYALKPGDVTDAWLDDRACEWITDMDADIAAGNI